MVTKGFFYNCFSIRYDEKPEPEAEEEEVESETEKEDDDKMKKDDDDKMRKKDGDNMMRGKKSGDNKQTPFFVFVIMAGALVIILA